MNPPSTQDTQLIHKQYRALTGLDVPYSMQTHFMWEAWLAAGYTEPDLACVVRYIKRRIGEKRREKESLLLRNLIARQGNFAEDLSLCRAESRQYEARTKDASKKSVMAATGRTMTEPEARPVVNVMEEHAKMSQLLKQWREANL